MNSETQALIQRGRQAFDHRDYVAALADFRHVLTEHPEFADIRNLTGLCLSFLGQLDAALEEFEHALSINDEYVEAHLNRAITLTELGRYEDAQAAFRRAAELERRGTGRFAPAVSARLANGHADLGDIYRDASALEEAVGQYRAALSLRPEFADIQQRLAKVLIQVGDLDAAQSALLSALRQNPRFVAARLGLGLIHYRRGAIDAAAREWQACREQDPDHPQVKTYLAMLERSRVPSETGAGGDAAVADEVTSQEAAEPPQPEDTID